MKKMIFRALSLVLALCLCCPVSAEGFLSGPLNLFTGEDFPVTAYADMEYARPDLDQLQALLDEACRLAQGSDSDAILEAVFEFYEAYDWFSTASALAIIHYSADLTDQHWAAENEFCMNAYPAVEQLHESLNAALSQSPCRRELERKSFDSGFFEDYGEESILDEALLELMTQESQLISRYYSQCGQMTTVLGKLFFQPQQAAQTLAELIGVRNQQAACLGWDSYEAYVNEFDYCRDYTPAELTAYLSDIQQLLVPIYLRARETAEAEEECTPSQALDYVRQTAQALGGTVWEAFRLMEEAGLYDIEAGAHKYDSAFEIYLPSYQEPFLFMNPYGISSDCLTLTHEFGHFCNDYASSGSTVGADVSEFFSQGLEYLSLQCHPEAEALIQYKMLNSLSIYVEQAFYARFEQEMYRLSEPTPEVLSALYSSLAEDYGMVDDYFSPWDFVNVSHFYTSPMYIPSYILSNDAAMQLYQLELEKPGLGRRCYERNLDTQQADFLVFLQEAGLESPFAPGRLEEAAQTFLAIFSAA